MKKKVFGFSMIEVLIVVSIIAVLALIIVPNVGKYLLKGESVYNKKMEDQLVLVGKEYYAKYKNKLPRGTSYSTFVSLSELESAGLVSEEFVDAKSGKCRDTSYVRVLRDFKTGKYTYHGCLDCENYKSNNNSCSISDLTHDYDFKCTVESIPDSGWRNEYEIKINASNNLGFINVYYGDGTHEKIDFLNTFIKNFVINKDLNRKKISDDNIFNVWIEDEAGNVEKCSKKVDLDVNEPTCSLEDKGNGKAEVTCSDTGGSGCKNSGFLVDIDKYTVAKADVYDNAGNKGDCEVQFDNEHPGCKVSKSPSSEWANTDVIITGKCSDEGKSATGCKEASVTKTITKEGIDKHSPGVVEDLVGHKTVCPEIDVKIDKTVPTVSIVNSSTNGSTGVWTNNSVTLTVTASDSGSGVDTIYYSTNNSDWYVLANGDSTSQIWDNSRNRSTIVYVKAKDKAGNYSEVVSTKVLIDIEPPTIYKHCFYQKTSTEWQFRYYMSDTGGSGLGKYKWDYCYSVCPKCHSSYMCSTKSAATRLSSNTSLYGPSEYKVTHYNIAPTSSAQTISTNTIFEVRDNAGNVYKSDTYVDTWTKSGTYSPGKC